MYYIVIRITLILLLSSILSAQSNYIITGQVVDSDTDEPMLYANLVLLKDTDSSQVAGTVTNADGNFKLENINEGKYFIIASFVGYQKVETPVFELKGNIYVGKLAISKLSILLDEVSVTGEKSTIETSLDKKVYNVGKDIISESGSASDILQNIPSLSVDVNGNVTLRGTSNVTFLINGRSSARLRRNAPIALQQMPAYTIERIEIITNPSAKYSAQGSGGIINIIQREDSETGFNGELIGNIGNEKRYNTSFIQSYGSKKLNNTLSYSLQRPSGKNIFSDKRIINNSVNSGQLSLYDENGSSLTKPLAHVFDAGLVIQPGDENIFEITGHYLSKNSNHKGSSDISLLDEQGQYEYKLQSNSTNDEYEREGEGGLAYSHYFNGDENHSLVLEGAYSGYDEQEDQTFNDIYSIPANESSQQKIFVNKTGHQYELIAEYAVPLNDVSDFEVGYLGEFINDNIYYNTEDNPNRFIFDQNVNSGYAIHNRDIGNFSLELGLRWEQTNVKSHLIEPIDSLIPNDYFNLFPSFKLAFEIDQFQNAGFSYGKRLNRPEADMLNPYPEYIDPRNAVSGNPLLKPEEIHSLELSYQNVGEQFTFTQSLFYRYKYNAFTDIANVYDDSVVVITTENLSDQRLAGIEVIFSGKLTDWWDFDLSASIYNDEINGSNLGYSNNKSSLSGLVDYYSLFRITRKTLLFQINFSYLSPVITPQGKKKEIFFLNAGIKQLLFSDQLSITFTITDILHTYKEIWDLDTPQLIQNTQLYRNEPVFYFGFSWRFGESYQGDEKQLEFEGGGLKKL